MEKKDYDEICVILFDNSRHDLIDKLTGTVGHNKALKLRKFEELMNPRFWGKDEHDAWHKNIPDVQAAFDALRKLNT